MDTKSNYIRAVDRGENDPRKDIKAIYNNAINTGTETEGKSKYDNGTALGRHLYEANIYMPISDKMVGIGIFNQQVVPQSRYIDVTEQAEENERRAQLRTNFD